MGSSTLGSPLRLGGSLCPAAHRAGARRARWRQKSRAIFDTPPSLCCDRRHKPSPVLRSLATSAKRTLRAFWPAHRLGPEFLILDAQAASPVHPTKASHFPPERVAVGVELECAVRHPFATEDRSGQIS